MLRSASFLRALSCRDRLATCYKVFVAFCGVLLSQRIALAEGRAGIVPLLAQESSGEGGYPISVFVICRSSRRN
jgi:hypothetical protein